MPPTTHHRITDLVGCNVDVSFPLHRLYDEYNLDHIPPEKRLDLFKKRNMARVKHYKAAVNVFGGPASRRRILVAPPMETPLKHKLGMYQGKTDPPTPPILNSVMEPRKACLSPILTESALADIREQDEVNNYKSWMQQRRQFRSGLENLGLNEKWLRNKTNRTAIEERMLHRFEVARHPVTPPPEPEVVVAQLSMPPPIPVMEVPAPSALEKLDRFVRLNQIRLFDIFVETDKNKDWKMTKQELMKIMQEKNIPISETELEDMITSLDTDMDECISYEELACGMAAWRKEKRDRGRCQSGSAHTGSSMSGPNSRQSSAPLQGKTTEEQHQLGTSRVAFITDFESAKITPLPSSAPADTREWEKKSPLLGAEREGEAEEKTGSAELDEKSRKLTPKLLTPPEVDTGLEHIQLSPEALVDLRKQTALILRHSRENSAGTAMYAGSVQEEYSMLTEASTCTRTSTYTYSGSAFAETTDTWSSQSETGKKSAPLPPGVIVTGNRAVDDHCKWSTMEGSAGEAVNKFRQKALHQYYQVVQLCQERDIVLSKKLLERVLLYPAEQPTAGIRGSIRQSGNLMTYAFATGRREVRKKRSKVSRRKERLLAMQNAEAANAQAASQASKGRAAEKAGTGAASLASLRAGRGASQQGEGLEEGPRRTGLSSKLPGRGTVSRPRRVTLPTGKAYISPIVDSWLTFEDFIDITGRMKGKFTDLNLGSHPNAFWPGQLVNKVVTVLDQEDREDWSGDAVFRTTGQKKMAYPGHHGGGLAAWPMSDSGYIVDGTYDPHRNKIKCYM